MFGLVHPFFVYRTRGLTMSHCWPLDSSMICRSFLGVWGSDRISRTRAWSPRFSSVNYCNCTTEIGFPRPGWRRQSSTLHHILCNRRRHPLCTFRAIFLSQEKTFTLEIGQLTRRREGRTLKRNSVKTVTFALSLFQTSLSSEEPLRIHHSLCIITFC